MPLSLPVPPPRKNNGRPSAPSVSSLYTGYAGTRPPVEKQGKEQARSAAPKKQQKKEKKPGLFSRLAHRRAEGKSRPRRRSAKPAPQQSAKPPVSAEPRSGQRPSPLTETVVGTISRGYETARRRSSATSYVERQPAAAKTRRTRFSRLFLPQNTGLHVNGAMLVILMLMLAFGLIMLFSASMIGSLYSRSGTTGYYITRQLFFTLLGLGFVGIVTRVNPSSYDKRPFALLSLAFSFLLLVLVLIPSLGILIQGARRWLPIPILGVTFQPSEATKIITVFYLAWHYSNLQKRRLQGFVVAEDPRRQAWLDAWEDIIKPMLVVFAQLFLISLQAHMSAVIIITTICVFLIASAGVKIGSWIRGGAVGFAALSVLLLFILLTSLLFPGAKVTQRWNHVITRINIFTDSANVTDEQKWQSDQALLAIGSGGLDGVGLGQSRQKYMYLPENHNDYLFSIICEETGFLGGGFVILLFGAYLIVGVRIAKRTTTLFSRILACGYTYLITLQAYLSIGVNVGILPPTGISLPFFSYGGTSNLFFLCGAGLLLSVSKFDNGQLPELVPLEDESAEEERSEPNV